MPTFTPLDLYIFGILGLTLSILALALGIHVFATVLARVIENMKEWRLPGVYYKWK